MSIFDENEYAPQPPDWNAFRAPKNEVADLLQKQIKLISEFIGVVRELRSEIADLNAAIAKAKGE